MGRRGGGSVGAAFAAPQTLPGVSFDQPPPLGGADTHTHLHTDTHAHPLLRPHTEPLLARWGGNGGHSMDIQYGCQTCAPTCTLAPPPPPSHTQTPMYTPLILVCTLTHALAVAPPQPGTQPCEHTQCHVCRHMCTVTHEHTRCCGCSRSCVHAPMCRLSHISSVPCAECVYTASHVHIQCRACRMCTQSHVCTVSCAECVVSLCEVSHVQTAECAQTHARPHMSTWLCVLSRHHTPVHATHMCTHSPMCTTTCAQTVTRVPKSWTHTVTCARITCAPLSCAHAASLCASLPCPSVPAQP